MGKFNSMEDFEQRIYGDIPNFNEKKHQAHNNAIILDVNKNLFENTERRLKGVILKHEGDVPVYLRIQNINDSKKNKTYYIGDIELNMYIIKEFRNLLVPYGVEIKEKSGDDIILFDDNKLMHTIKVKETKEIENYIL